MPGGHFQDRFIPRGPGIIAPVSASDLLLCIPRPIKALPRAGQRLAHPLAHPGSRAGAT